MCMVKKLSIYIAFLLLASTVFSCMGVGQKVVDWMSVAEGDVKVEGEYHFLEEDGVRVFLPLSFKRYSMAEYQQTLKSKLPKAEADAQINNILTKKQIWTGSCTYILMKNRAPLVWSMPFPIWKFQKETPSYF